MYTSLYKRKGNKYMFGESEKVLIQSLCNDKAQALQISQPRCELISETGMRLCKVPRGAINGG